jgi:hypothetical protein
MGEKRRYERVAYNGPIRISWESERGEVMYAQGKCVDVSEAGLRIEVPEPVPVRTYITLRADRINVSGRASVRSVDRRGTRFVLGLELSQEIRDQTIAKLLSDAAPQP